MKAVLRTTDRALLEMVRIELEGQGIAVVLEQETASALPFMPVTVLVADSEFTRALQIVQETAPTIVASSSEPTRSRRAWRGILLALVIATLIVCGTIFIG